MKGQTLTGMETEFKADVFFHLTGKRRGSGLDSIEGLHLRPALFARYAQLERLRYDFPLVLLDDDSQGTWVRSLSEIFDTILEKIAQDAEVGRVTAHALRVEQEIRTLVAQGTRGSFSALWDRATLQLTASDALFRDSVERLAGAHSLDGEVIDCDARTPERLFGHAWEMAARRKARRFHERVDRLVEKLSDILRADFARSAEGQSPERLRASVGTRFENAFDFDAMSRLLRPAPSNGAAGERDRRIRWLLSVLLLQRFFPESHEAGGGEKPYSFIFENCASAVEAYQERLPEMVELLKALAMAELEIDGRYEPSRHDDFFAEFDPDSVEASEAGLFPDYFVSLHSGRLSAVEAATMTEALLAGLPLKVLVQTDDLLAPRALGKGELASSLGSNRIASSMLGGRVFVLQSSNSALVELREPIYRGMEASGPALFSVFSGASESTNRVPPYLVAAAAMESRAFPAFVYDPAAGRDWASRFTLDRNPQPEADWPLHPLSYEDAAHQKASENYAFTLVDFLACDRRHARDFAKVSRTAPDADLVAVSRFLDEETDQERTQLPYVLMCNEANALEKVMVPQKLVREARHCRDAWHSLQELAGIHNSHAERLRAEERRKWEEELRGEAAGGGNGQMKPGTLADSAPATSAIEEHASPRETETAPSTDEPYIETPRCTSCNECLQVNKKMFAYNSEKQAFIADPEAGTYRQLVEAAENCPVSIIHPGKPRRPGEVGLEELLERAAPFL